MLVVTEHHHPVPAKRHGERNIIAVQPLKRSDMQVCSSNFIPLEALIIDLPCSNHMLRTWEQERCALNLDPYYWTSGVDATIGCSWYLWYNDEHSWCNHRFLWCRPLLPMPQPIQRGRTRYVQQICSAAPPIWIAQSSRIPRRNPRTLGPASPRSLQFIRLLRTTPR